MSDLMFFKLAFYLTWLIALLCAGRMTVLQDKLRDLHKEE